MKKPIPWYERLHWPSVVLFAVIAVCAAASPVAFFALVPERIVDKLFALPWTTILAVGGPAIAAAILVIKQALAPAAVEPASKPHVSPDAVRSDERPPSGGPHR